jgi:uncharacterized damage-inducible protein DinB
MQSTAIDPKAPPAGLGGAYIAYCRRRLMKEYLPRIESCLEGLSDTDIWWRAHETDNSIGNLLMHMSGNVRQWVVTGLGGSVDIRDRSLEFSERNLIPKQLLLERLKDTLRQADAVLARFSESKLLEVRHIQRYDVTCLDAISHVVEHFAQHLGQIIYITKLRSGRDMKFYDL